jgi:hypothetical protein
MIEDFKKSTTLEVHSQQRYQWIAPFTEDLKPADGQ